MLGNNLSTLCHELKQLSAECVHLKEKYKMKQQDDMNRVRACVCMCVCACACVCVCMCVRCGGRLHMSSLCYQLLHIHNIVLVVIYPPPSMTYNG